MSISRKNWSALSSLARQWTMEDEEEIEREKRRRVKSSSGNNDSDSEDSQTPRDTKNTESASEKNPPKTPPAYYLEQKQFLKRDRNYRAPLYRNLIRHLSDSVEQIQLDFVEMLRVRNEKRRLRHVETLRRQKEVGEDEAATSSGGARVELLGDLDEEEASLFSPEKAAKPEPLLKSTSHSPVNSSSANTTSRQQENRKSSDPKPASNPARKFVSSVSISLEKSPSASGCTSPMSPRSPTPSSSSSSREHWPSPCQSPSPQGAQSLVHNGHTQETSVNGSPINSNFEQTSKPAFVRQSSRTISFRMMRKKEEDSSPLQRSASVRMASKKFEFNSDQNEDEDKASSFQRNSRQRISSRSIQEKMERLAQAAQKSEVLRSPDVTQRTLFLLDEVSRKRGLFEKEQQAACPSSPGISREEFRSFTSGMSDRINRWLNKTSQPGSALNPTDLRHVDISSKRSIFESREEDSFLKSSPGKI